MLSELLRLQIENSDLRRLWFLWEWSGFWLAWNRVQNRRIERPLPPTCPVYLLKLVHRPGISLYPQTCGLVHEVYGPGRHRIAPTIGRELYRKSTHPLRCYTACPQAFPVPSRTGYQPLWQESWVHLCEWGRFFRMGNNLSEGYSYVTKWQPASKWSRLNVKWNKDQIGCTHYSVPLGSNSTLPEFVLTDVFFNITGFWGRLNWIFCLEE